MVIFKLGNADHPASDADIKDFTKLVRKARRKSQPIVTHHLVDVVFIPDHKFKVKKHK